MADTCSTADCKGKLTGQSALWGIEDTVSNIILEAVPLFRPFICHKFYIQLALPISPETMDRFWCSRCLNDHIKVLNMMRLFVGRTTTPLVVKIWTKHPWVKIENLRNFDLDFVLFRGKIWLWLFYNFFALWFQNSTKKSQVVLSKNEGVTVIFLNFDIILNRENQCHSFIFAWNDLKFFV